jgi:hypothetical protein
MKCCGGKGKPIVVPYMFRAERRYYSCCSFCDSPELWPVFANTSPPTTKKK